MFELIYIDILLWTIKKPCLNSKSKSGLEGIDDDGRPGEELELTIKLDQLCTVPQIDLYTAGRQAGRQAGRTLFFLKMHISIDCLDLI
jgi:hypothetical protein